MIQVALLDDHPAVLTGLLRLLEPAHDLEVVAAEPDAVTLARSLDGRRADVVITDYDPERCDALMLCSRIKSRPTPPAVVLYTAYATPALAIAARAAQADGLVDKSAPAAVLLDAVRRVADGETAMPVVGRDVFEAAVARLEDRDLPVFAMLLDGEPPARIAEALHCDEREAARRARRVVGRLRPGLASATARPVRGGSRIA
jgi:DNA-binding NarL/FixJ family response regulator